GWQGYANLTAVGSRYYDRENDILAPGYGIVDAGVAYRFDRWTLRLDGRNLTDRRPAVSESELGPDQFYVMPARYVELGATFGWD
ncbi:MAG: TonB-dependent receptor, partial [Gammaproteobacteria bacterium]